MVEVGQVGRAANEFGQSAFYLHFQRGAPFGAADDLVKAFLRAGDDKVSQQALHYTTSPCKKRAVHDCSMFGSWSALLIASTPVTMHGARKEHDPADKSAHPCVLPFFLT